MDKILTQERPGWIRGGQECSYKDMPLVNGDYDLSKFSTEQLKEFYWDHPESIPDAKPGCRVMFVEWGKVKDTEI